MHVYLSFFVNIFQQAIGQLIRPQSVSQLMTHALLYAGTELKVVYVTLSSLLLLPFLFSSFPHASFILPVYFLVILEED